MICFKCLKKLEPVFPDNKWGYRQPSGGLTFTAAGNYGSTVYDPTTRAPELVIWICDECMREHHGLVRMRSIERLEPAVIWADWDPDAGTDAPVGK